MQSDTWPAWRLRESLIIQKYSNSSVADHRGIQRVARRIVDTQRAGFSVVVVLPEMESATNELSTHPAGLAPLGESGELDLAEGRREQIFVPSLEIAISKLGAAPHVFTGGEAGLITDGIHGKAHIVGVDPLAVVASLARKEIPIVAGFQGTNREANMVTTMGRDGSDLMAVALAASMNALVCEIYSDFDGLYTADPRIVPAARKVQTITSAQMMALAAAGAKVLPRRCIEYARRLGVTIHVRSPFNPDEGTVVVSGLEDEPGTEHSATLEEPMIMGLTQDRTQMQVTVAGVPTGPGAAQLFGVTAALGVCAEMITHRNDVVRRSTDISFILPATQIPTVVAAVSKAQEAIGFQSLKCEEVGKLSLSGFGMRLEPDVLCRFLGVLSDSGINIRLFSDSSVSISAVTDLEMLDLGARAMREAFHLSDDLGKGYAEKHMNQSVNHKG
jgi:aspartate kinase